MEFSHLNLKQIFDGKPKYSGFGLADSPQSLRNLKDRKGHTASLRKSAQLIEEQWEARQLTREDLGLPKIIDDEVMPILLQVDPQKFDIESLSSYNIEIISEEEDGYILGATVDNFQGLKKKIAEFEEEKRDKNNVIINKSQARLWSITDGIQWKVDHILSESLQEKWHKLQDQEILILDVGIACYLKIRDFPDRKPNHNDARYQELIDIWQRDKEVLQEKRDEIADTRKDNFIKLIKGYEGQIVEGPVDTEDSFGFRVQISARALKDIVFNYQYIFDIVEVEDIIESPTYGTGFDLNNSLELLAPPSEAPSICVIDSGIMEGHKYLSLAIDSAVSTNFLPGSNDVADYVQDGGHGTRVAGAILFPDEIPTNGVYQLPFWIQNARVLDDKKQMPKQLYPPKLMRDIVDRFPETRIFNLSINYRVPCRTTHMSAWAAAIDQLMWEKDVLFIISTGNLSVGAELHSSCPGIKDHIKANRPFPQYLSEKSCRISNPAQSSFAITVGSISGEHYDDDLRHSISQPGHPSSFTKTGLGMWGSIKPDVVEFGGDLVKTKKLPLHVFAAPKTAPCLIRSTLHGGGAFGRDSVGTSYAAPKISHIAGKLQEALPNESTLMYRALIAQSARLTNENYRNPNLTHIRTLGYGLPDVDRAIGNSETRVTLISSGYIGASQIHIFSVKIPKELREIGDDFNVMIEVTLSYKARPRRTRRRTKSYLSTWLDWEVAKLDDTFGQFRRRMVFTSEQVEFDSYQEEKYVPNSTIPWAIDAQHNRGKVRDIKRQDSTLQKDWCIVESNKLPAELLIAVRGHKGWDKDANSMIPYSLVVSLESLETEVAVYERVMAENQIEVQVNAM